MHPYSERNVVFASPDCGWRGWYQLLRRAEVPWCIIVLISRAKARCFDAREHADTANASPVFDALSSINVRTTSWRVRWSQVMAVARFTKTIPWAADVLEDVVCRSAGWGATRLLTGISRLTQHTVPTPAPPPGPVHSSSCAVPTQQSYLYPYLSQIAWRVKHIRGKCRGALACVSRGGATAPTILARDTRREGKRVLSGMGGGTRETI